MKSFLNPVRGWHVLVLIVLFWIIPFLTTRYSYIKVGVNIVESEDF